MIHRTLAAMLTFGLTGCAAGLGPSPDVPDSHTIVQESVRHAPGGGDPEQNCAACHGIQEVADDGVACIDCHSSGFLSRSGGEGGDGR